MGYDDVVKNVGFDVDGRVDGEKVGTLVGGDDGGIAVVGIDVGGDIGSAVVGSAVEGVEVRISVVCEEVGISVVGDPVVGSNVGPPGHMKLICVALRCRYVSICHPITFYQEGNITIVVIPARVIHWHAGPISTSSR